MDNIFGISVMSILYVLLVILGICLLSVGYIAWRNRVIFKMAVRNIPRRKTQGLQRQRGLTLRLPKVRVLSISPSKKY
jgi:uncharacterized iron-regulated membrane protein